MSRMSTLILTTILALGTGQAIAQDRPAENPLPGVDPIAVHKLSSPVYAALAPTLLGIPPIVASRASELGPLSETATLSIVEENATSTSDHEAEPAVVAISKSGLTHTVTTYFRYISPSPFPSKLYSSQKPRAGSWSTTAFPQNALYSWYGDPTMDGNFSTTGAAPGRIYTSGVMFNSPSGPTGIGIWRSDDAGVTWTGPVVVASQATGSLILDKPSVAVAPGSNAQHGFVYVSYVLADTSNASNTKIFCAGSVDGGVTFGAPVLVTTGNIEDPQVMVEPTVNAVYIAYPNYDDSSIRMKRSTSAGVAWDPESIGVTGRPFVLPANEFIGVGAGTIRALTLPTARFNAVANRVSIVWHEREASISSNRFTDIWYISKTPTGWTTPIKISDSVAGRDQFQPALDYDESGNMFVGFYDRREDASNILYKEYAANIRSDGTALRVNFATNSFSTNPSSSIVPGFIGDYQTTFYSNYGDLQQWVSSFSGVGVGGTNNDVWLAHIM